MKRYPENKRRKYFIDKEFQSKFILKFCFLVILTSILTGIFIYLFNWNSNTVAFDDLRIVVKTTADFIMPIIVAIITIVTVLVAVSTIFIALFTSHRISGPIFRILQELDKIKSGDLRNPIRTRSKDHFHRVAAEFEEVRMTLKDSLKNLKDNWGPVKALMEKDPGNVDVGQIRKNIQNITDEFSKYKVD